MARIVTPPATVTSPAARTLDAPNSRPDYPLVRPAPLSRVGVGAVTRTLERLSGLRLSVTAVRLAIECDPAEGRELASRLQSDLLLTEYRPGLGLLALYVGPRPAGPAGDRVLEARIVEELTRALFAEPLYAQVQRCAVAMVHRQADMLVDGMLDQALHDAPATPLVDLLPRAA